MRTMNQLVMLSLSLVLLVSAAAVADDPVMIRVYNDDADAIVVTVYDVNARPQGAVLANQRIDGFAWVPVSVTAGALGKGHVKWTARTADTGLDKCGYQEAHGVTNDAFLYIHADSKCRKSAW
jgi:hypothetical protein